MAGGPLAFTEVEVLVRAAEGHALSKRSSLADLRRWLTDQGRQGQESLSAQLDLIAFRRRPWAGLALDRPRIMGVLNVTPDSFSDGGNFLDPARAIEQGRALLTAGAEIIDIGGESTRPRAAPVSPEEEIRRVEPVVKALAEAGAMVSIDTRHASVMATALERGARIINDVSALTGDPASLSVAARYNAAVVLMHMAGDPRTMQEAPRYDDPVLDVLDFLEARIASCLAAGLPREALVVDPGIGFGKNDRHNRALLSRVAVFHGTGCGVALGASRKSFIGRLGGGGAPKQRLGGSLAVALWAAGAGVQILRVHDVAETRQALMIREAIVSGAALTEF
ncbi:MAG TPA: dihydropteroate synthase [Stellaceae bacterium]|nr:dihydropteroate synthase [Stellaceae bacterium]